MSLFAFSAIAAAANSGGGNTPPWSPVELFTLNDVGGWYDPRDLATMFQDSNGTVPVQSDGDLVGKLLDKSGQGNDLTADDNSERPIYRTNGVHHWLEYNASNKTALWGTQLITDTQERTVAVGAMATGDGCILSLQDNGNPPDGGDWSLTAEDKIYIRVGGGAVSWGYPGDNIPFTTSVRFSPTIDGTIGGSEPFLNGNPVSLASSSSRTVNTSSGGRWSMGYSQKLSGDSSPERFDGRIYQLVLINRRLTNTEIQKVSSFIANRIG